MSSASTASSVPAAPAAPAGDPDPEACGGDRGERVPARDPADLIDFGEPAASVARKGSSVVEVMIE